MAAALTPSLPRFSTRRSAPRLVRTKSSDFSWPRQMAAATLTLSIWCTWRKRCSMSVTVWVRRPPRGRPDRSGSACTRRSTAPSRVAENSSVWWGCSRRRSTHSTWGMKPMSAMRSASSSTSISSSVHRDLAPVAQVDEPARGGDDHVDALAQLGDLAVDVGAAVDGDGPEPEPLGQRGQDVVHLDGQLPGRAAGPGPAAGPGGWRRAVPLGVTRRLGPLQERQTEGQGLARAGLGLAAHVTPGQGVGDGQGLNWKSADDALIGQRFGEFR